MFSGIKQIFTEKRKSRKLILGFGVFLLTFLVLFFSDHGIFKRISLEAKRRELVEKYDAEKLKKDSILKVIEKLKTDTLEIERIAREKYGMVKPGEEVFFIKKKTQE
eukprot:TRINITY_DN13183_c0_g1_i1.p2 TRINITY_DN13183_c0_g1~~TRINITY_DN13183_c0_g1_i1.p2  ORF type:complete len:107 (+),score=0.12 TRINITY_DN13183_c0_g1_i1:1004-1324(+)